jgi:RHS repeat-associated protein
MHKIKSKFKKRIWAGGKIIADVHSGVTYYALGDANKNLTEYLDNLGAIQEHTEYSPFGKVTVQNGTMAGQFDYGFSSEFSDDETGLVYYNYRYYSPEVGRWLRRDPIMELGGENLYVIVSNKSINYIDYLGLWEYYGNWGGPDYTGGQNSSWDQMTPAEQNQALAAIDAQDACYEGHDKCYGDCRNKYQCETARNCCFSICDAILEGCLLSTNPFGGAHWYSGLNQAGATIIFPIKIVVNPFIGVGTDATNISIYSANATWNATTNAASTGWDATTNAASTGWDATTNAASTGWDATTNAVSTGWNTATSWVR